MAESSSSSTSLDTIESQIDDIELRTAGVVARLRELASKLKPSDTATDMKVARLGFDDTPGSATPEWKAYATPSSGTVTESLRFEFARFRNAVPGLSKFFGVEILNGRTGVRVRRVSGNADTLIMVRACNQCDISDIDRTQKQDSDGYGIYSEGASNLRIMRVKIAGGVHPDTINSRSAIRLYTSNEGTSSLISAAAYSVRNALRLMSGKFDGYGVTAAVEQGAGLQVGLTSDDMLPERRPDDQHYGHGITGVSLSNIEIVGQIDWNHRVRGDVVLAHGTIKLYPGQNITRRRAPVDTGRLVLDDVVVEGANLAGSFEVPTRLNNCTILGRKLSGVFGPTPVVAW